MEREQTDTYSPTTRLRIDKDNFILQGRFPTTNTGVALPFQVKESAVILIFL